MEISVTKDLAALRGAALLRVDQSIARRRARLDACADIHAAKLAEARLILSVGAGNQPVPLLGREAGPSFAALRSLAETVIEKAARTGEAVAGLEAARQAAQALIRAAATPAAIDTVVSDIERQECP